MSLVGVVELHPMHHLPKIFTSYQHCCEIDGLESSCCNDSLDLSPSSYVRNLELCWVRTMMVSSWPSLRLEIVSGIFWHHTKILLGLILCECGVNQTDSLHPFSLSALF